MSTVVSSIAITNEYTNTDFTRKYTVKDVTDEAVQQAETKIAAVNASLAAGTAGGLSSVMISDDFDETTGTGYLNKIGTLQITTSQVTDIDWTVN